MCCCIGLYMTCINLMLNRSTFLKSKLLLEKKNQKHYITAFAVQCVNSQGQTLFMTAHDSCLKKFQTFCGSYFSPRFSHCHYSVFGFTSSKSHSSQKYQKELNRGECYHPDTCGFKKNYSMQFDCYYISIILITVIIMNILTEL